MTIHYFLFIYKSVYLINQYTLPCPATMSRSAKEKFRLRSYFSEGKGGDEVRQIELQSLLTVSIFRTIVYFMVLEEKAKDHTVLLLLPYYIVLKQNWQSRGKCWRSGVLILWKRRNEILYTWCQIWLNQISQQAFQQWSDMMRLIFILWKTSPLKTFVK